MAWEEIITYFRSANYIISGGNVVERHIMKDNRYLLAIFLKSINNINLSSNNNNLYTLSSNLLQLYRYNSKELIKFIKPNIDLTSKNINKDIEKKVDYYYNDFNIINKLKIKIINFINNKIFINKLYKHLSIVISKNNLDLFIKIIKNNSNIKNNINSEILLLFDNILNDTMDLNKNYILINFINDIINNNKEKNKDKLNINKKINKKLYKK